MEIICLLDTRILVIYEFTIAMMGHLRGELAPVTSVVGDVGWIDIPYGVSARKLSSGEYVIFAEEVYHAKTLMYRWTPLDHSKQTKGYFQSCIKL